MRGKALVNGSGQRVEKMVLSVSTLAGHQQSHKLSVKIVVQRFDKQKLPGLTYGIQPEIVAHSVWLRNSWNYLPRQAGLRKLRGTSPCQSLWGSDCGFMCVTVPTILNIAVKLSFSDRRDEWGD